MIYLRAGVFAEGPSDYHFLCRLLDRLLDALAASLFPSDYELADTLGIDAPFGMQAKRAERIAAAIVDHRDRCELFVIHADGAGEGSQRPATGSGGSPRAPLPFAAFPAGGRHVHRRFAFARGVAGVAALGLAGAARRGAHALGEVGLAGDEQADLGVAREHDRIMVLPRRADITDQLLATGMAALRNSSNEVRSPPARASRSSFAVARLGSAAAPSTSAASCRKERRSTTTPD